jgi:nitronate monooxygenase
MFLVSGPDLVIASCRAGVAGSFPTLNARTTAILDQWLERITAELQAGGAPHAVNLIVHPTNTRLAEDVALVIKHKPPLVIASVGNPQPVIAAVKGYGGLTFSDVASLKHARRAAEAGVDGLILLCAGSGGNTGWLNPFAFVAAVRKFFAGPLVLAGAISNGRLIHVAEELGADFAYVGTPFIATTESMAADDYRQMLIESDADDIQLTAEVTGIPANMLRKSLERSGFKPGPKHAGFNLLKEIETLKAWRDIWSAGQGVGDVERIEPVASLVDRMLQDYQRARVESRQRLATNA